MRDHGKGEGRLSEPQGDCEPHQIEGSTEAEMVLSDVSEAVQG